MTNRQPDVQHVPGTQGNAAPRTPGTANPNTRFWGIWLPVPTVLAIFTSIFFTWLILNTVGFPENPIEQAGEQIIEQF